MALGQLFQRESCVRLMKFDNCHRTVASSGAVQPGPNFLIRMDSKFQMQERHGRSRVNFLGGRVEQGRREGEVKTLYRSFFKDWGPNLKCSRETAQKEKHKREQVCRNRQGTLGTHGHSSA